MAASRPISAFITVFPVDYYLRALAYSLGFFPLDLESSHPKSFYTFLFL